jgi:hypothetical protein
VRWCSEHGLPHSALLAWSEQDRAKLIAHLLEESARCQMCGTSPWEWEDDPFAYEPAQEMCRGCYLRETAADDAGSANRGVRVVLVPKRVAERRREQPAKRPARPVRA